MTYKYNLRSGSESKVKYEINNQNQSQFDSIIDLNWRVVTPPLSHTNPSNNLGWHRLSGYFSQNNMPYKKGYR